MSQEMRTMQQIWKEAFQLTLTTQRKYKARLKELETWDTHGYDLEAKKAALKELIR